MPALRAQEPRPPRFVTQSLGLFYFPDTHSSNPTAFENRFKTNKKTANLQIYIYKAISVVGPHCLKEF